NPGSAPGRFIVASDEPSGGSDSTPSARLLLANTGVQIAGLTVTGLALVALGTAAAVAGRRRRQEP
ncbi:MAG: LPXTG cell wall anchor domain-containing protein, partial [Actinobacteria bacterium]|nr:LPXTG cell wall anchor domain-containing protein [Actinomycetota bacterium]